MPGTTTIAAPTPVRQPIDPFDVAGFLAAMSARPTTSPPSSTHVPANDTASAPPPKSSSNYCPQTQTTTVLRDCLEPLPQKGHYLISQSRRVAAPRRD